MSLSNPNLIFYILGATLIFTVIGASINKYRQDQEKKRVLDRLSAAEAKILALEKQIDLLIKLQNKTS